MKFVQPPLLLRWFFPNITWNKSREEKKIYLTFDDGPIPEITPWVLDTLSHYNAKATFFCVGENIQKHPLIFERIRTEGHQVGNHTFNHLKGWAYETETYMENVRKCQELTQTSLFRPPHLRPTRKQLKELKKQFEIIFFDVLSYDFDVNISPEECFANVIKNSKSGSIIVFHDNIKAIPRLQYSLPKLLENLSKQGYTFDRL